MTDFMANDYADIGRRLGRLRSGPPWYEKPPLGPAPAFTREPSMAEIAIVNATMQRFAALKTYCADRREFQTVVERIDHGLDEACCIFRTEFVMADGSRHECLVDRALVDRYPGVDYALERLEQILRLRELNHDGS